MQWTNSCTILRRQRTRRTPVPLLYDETRLNLAQNSFIVQVPSGIYATQLDKVRGIVEQYRPLSKTPIYAPIN